MGAGCLCLPGRGPMAGGGDSGTASDGTMEVGESASELREAGNRQMRAGDAAGAASLYEAALGCEAAEDGDVAAPIHGNLSAAYLSLGDAVRALHCAEQAVQSDREYAKGYFRRARALLALGRPHAAAASARLAFFLQEGEGAKDFQALLDNCTAEAAVQRGALAAGKRGRLAFGSGGPASPSQLDSAVELPSMLKRYLDAEGLVHLGRCARRLRAEVTEEDFRACAARSCPSNSRAWLREDTLRVEGWPSGAGWLCAARQSAARGAARNRLAVCTADCDIVVCEPVQNGGEARRVAYPGHGLPFSMCWGPRGEYIAFTAVISSSTTALVVAAPPHGSAGGTPEPLVTALQPGLVPYYLCPSPCGTRLALLGTLGRQQALLLADVSQVTAPEQELAPPVSLRILGAAAPLYFDWAPGQPDLVLLAEGSKIQRITAETLLEAKGEAALEQHLREPELHPPLGFGEPVFRLTGRGEFRAPQWLPWPGTEGRWLVPRDAADGRGRSSLALVDPVTGTAEVATGVDR